MSDQIVISEQDNQLVLEDSKTQLVVVTDNQATIVEVQARGPQGVKGDKGDASTNSVFIAGMNLGGHRIVASSPTENSKVIYADSSISSHANLVLGMTLNAANEGDEISVAIFGEFTEPSWNWVLGQPIFLANDGTMTQVTPTANEANFSLIVAIPITATKIFVSIREPIFLI